MSEKTRRRSIQVKICGLTRVDEAVACAELGADAIGMIFYPPSPRFVSDETALEISRGLPERVWRVGVFVDEPVDEVMRKVETCRLSAVQLHGTESPAEVEEIEAAGIAVIKSVFMKKDPLISDALRYRASAYLVEGGEGPLPGGNAMAWGWGSAREALGGLPCILAGGLHSGNVMQAMEEFSPDAVDVSSGVESMPGRKDIEKVGSFLEMVRSAPPGRAPRRIFK